MMDTEKRLIIDTLEKCGYKCSLAAHELGIDKATFYRKLKAYSIALRRDKKSERGA